MKKILFSIITIFLFFITLDLAVRIYLSLKYKDMQYLKPAVSIDYTKSKYISPEELKIEGQLLSMHGKGYYKLVNGKFGHYRDRKFSFTINSLNFRGEEFSLKKGQGICRVCVLGGSSIWGHGLDDDQTVPFYLSESLGKKYEVINCGFPRYRMKEIYNLFRYELIAYSPGIVVAYEAYNDAFNTDLVTYKNILYKLHEMLYYKWMLYTILLEKYSAIKYGTPLPFFHVVKEIPNDYSKNLGLLIELAKKKEIEVILVKQPLNLSSKEVSREDDEKTLEQKYARTKDEETRCIIRHYYYNQQMEELAKKNELILIDAVPLMEGKKEFFLGDPIHLSPVGAKKLAELISNGILKNEIDI